MSIRLINHRKLLSRKWSVSNIPDNRGFTIGPSVRRLDHSELSSFCGAQNFYANILTIFQFSLARNCFLHWLLVTSPVCVISSIQRNHLVDYIGSHYKAPRIVLAAAGGVDHDKLCGLADKYLNKLSVTYEDSFAGVPDAPKAIYTGSEVRMLWVCFVASSTLC